MSALVQFATCKICKTKVEVPPLPAIVGELPEQKQIRITGLILATICAHFVKAHPESRVHSQMWAELFTEFYFGAMFDLKECQVLKDQYDAKRLLLLGLCQSAAPERDFDSSGAILTPEAMTQHFEETERISELTAAGYRITRGFLGAASGERIVKEGG